MKRVLIFLILASFAVAVFAADAKPDIKRIIKLREPGKPALGLVISNPDEQTLESAKLEGGALVLDVLEDSEAERIGLKEDDIIIRFDGREIGNAEQLNDLAENILDEKTVEIVVQREAGTKTFSAALKPVHGEHEIKVNIDDDDIVIDLDKDLPDAEEHEALLHINDLNLSSQKGGFLGVEVKNISGQLKEYFEVKDGVLIEKVIKESAAEKAGLKAGDVITAINDRIIKDYEDLVRTLNYFNPKEKITVKYSRKGRMKSADVVLGEKKERRFNLKKQFLPLRPGLQKLRGKFRSLHEKLPYLKKMSKEKKLEIYII